MNYSYIGEKEFQLNVAKVLSKYLSSSFLFYGLEGIGKRTFASIICNNILNFFENNTEFKNSLDDSFFDCNKYLHNKSSNLFLNNSHPDFFLLESIESKNIPIDLVRKLKNFLNKTSSVSSAKAVLIDSIDFLSINGLNMLLKSLEEPPENTFIFLISHKQSDVLKTIQSRLFKFYFKPLNQENFLKVLNEKKLIDIPDKEKINLGSFYNFSPGLSLKNYDENFFLNYERFVDFFEKNLINNNNYNFYDFLSSGDKIKDESINLAFINRLFKMILLAKDTEFKKLYISQNEEKVVNLAKDSPKMYDLVEKHNKLQKDLYLANILNDNKLEILNVFLKSFND